MSHPLAAIAVCAASAALPTAALAHEVLHQVEGGRAVAVRIFYPDGEALAYAEYELFSPADRTVPHQRGRTDRNGWLSFVPDAPGKWRMKVVDASGHGLDTGIDVGTAAAAGGGSGAANAAPGARPGPGSVAFVLRPLLGVVAIGALFGALVLFYRRRRVKA